MGLNLSWKCSKNHENLTDHDTFIKIEHVVPYPPYPRSWNTNFLFSPPFSTSCPMAKLDARVANPRHLQLIWIAAFFRGFVRTRITQRFEFYIWECPSCLEFFSFIDINGIRFQRKNGGIKKEVLHERMARGYFNTHLTSFLLRKFWKRWNRFEDALKRNYFSLEIKIKWCSRIW